MSHTPGPWVVDDEHGALVVRSREHGLVADVGPFNPQANARLIAAAPSLLEALEDALERWSGSMSDAEVEAWLELRAVKRAQAAINKATGEQP